LAVNIPLVVVPDPAAGSGKHCLNGKEILHLLRLEDPTLLIYEGDTLVLEKESWL
jgi:hypothetical protein